MGTKASFEKEAKGNSEIAYCNEEIFRVVEEEEMYIHFKITK